MFCVYCGGGGRVDVSRRTPFERVKMRKENWSTLCCLMTDFFGALGHQKTPKIFDLVFYDVLYNIILYSKRFPATNIKGLSYGFFGCVVDVGRFHFSFCSFWL